MVGEKGMKEQKREKSEKINESIKSKAMEARLVNKIVGWMKWTQKRTASVCVYV